jgi:hypothetical protein
MPFQAALPTWLAINNMNSAYDSGQGDSVTGFPYEAGGLGVGDYFDLTTSEAFNASYTTNGVLYSGRYRYVQVDSGATAANVKTGTVGYMRSGSSVSGVVTTNAGSGLTNGTYQIAANAGSGGGSGAIISIIVASGAIVGNPSVVSGGYGYVSVPTFSLTTLGGTGAAITVQLNATPNVVTSADQALSTNAAAAAMGAVRPVVFLNSITPGNYGFIQELGIATVLTASGATQAVNNNAITTAAGSTPIGLMAASASTYSFYTIGTVIDVVTSPLVNTPFKILLNLPVVQD